MLTIGQTRLLGISSSEGHGTLQPRPLSHFCDLGQLRPQFIPPSLDEHGEYTVVIEHLSGDPHAGILPEFLLKKTVAGQAAYRVRSVDPSSEAARLGVQPGDEILALDGDESFRSREAFQHVDPRDHDFRTNQHATFDWKAAHV